ncbi:hypothetical protein BVC80_1327g3 [Macleaya cordata]|uniref:Reverse transcriptase zinc-binding domain n=1 Tax=Macleaya cordata TaxID=56857 RepID=A0A200PPG9_MACCD|nr:hypothetical protein BVC80_1327g3 [Macleaya cordata]
MGIFWGVRKFGVYRLGFRNLEGFNLALLAKIGWRLLSERDTLWVQILKHKYFLHGNPLKIISKKNSSWLWKCITKGFIQIKKFGVWEIRDGSRVDIWEDIWIPNITTLTEKPSIDTLSNINKVKDLSIEGTRVWNSDLLAICFDAQIVNKIKNIRIPSHGHDQFRWSLNNNGNFSVKSLFEAMYYVEVSTTINWIKVWSIDCLPRIQIFVWKCLSDILPLNVFLEQCGLTYLVAFIWKA